MRVRQLVRLLPGALTLGLLVSAPSTAYAAVYSFQPNPTDMADLDHTKAYVWVVDATSVKNDPGAVTSASITFKNIFNWDAKANELYVHLFKDLGTMNATTLSGWSSVTSGGNVLQYTDSASDTTIADYFTTTPAWLVGNTFLTQFSFPGVQSSSPYIQAPDTGTGTANPGEQMTYNNNGTSGIANDDYWTYNDKTGTAAAGGSGGAFATHNASNGGTWKATYGDNKYVPEIGRTAQLYTYTYTFSTGELAALNAAINTSLDSFLALGLDPDCHFYNDGVTLTLTTPNTPSVPEPASLVLLGSGLALARALKRRRAKHAAAAL